MNGEARVRRADKAVEAVGSYFTTSSNLRLADSTRYGTIRELVPGAAAGQPFGDAVDDGDGLAEGDGFPDGLALPASTRALRTRSRAAPWAFA